MRHATVVAVHHSWRVIDGRLRIDRRVRQSPERAYDIDFFEEFARAAGWRIP